MPSNPGARAHRHRRPDPALLESLRARIRKLDGVAPAADGGPCALPLGAAAIDAALPWGGLPRASLHELVGDDASVDGGNAAAAGFSAALLGRFAAATGAPVLWCRRGPGLYGPGLARFGLGPECLVVARTGSATAVLWAMEEGLASGALAAVLGEVETVSTTARRRLQLAAEKGGTAAFLLRSAHGAPVWGAAVTRWRIGAAPTSFPLAPDGRDLSGVGAARWRVELVRCRGARPSGAARHTQNDAPGLSEALAAWLVDWQDEPTGGFTVVAELRGGPIGGSLEAAPAHPLPRRAG
jgi:protein ImuA